MTGATPQQIARITIEQKSLFIIDSPDGEVVVLSNPQQERILRQGLQNG